MAEERVLLKFRPGFGREAYNGGNTGIYFDRNNTEDEVDITAAQTLSKRWPKNFSWEYLEEQEPEPFEGEAEDGGEGSDFEEEELEGFEEEDFEEESEGGEEPKLTKEFLESEVSYNDLRKLGTEVAREGESVPRQKEPLINFILERQ